MNDEKVSAEELAEDRHRVQRFRDAGFPEYWACMFAAQIRVAS